MSIIETRPEAVLPGAATVSLGQFWSVASSGAHPTYMVLNALDRNEYTASSSGDTGVFTGNGATLGFSSIGGDGRGCGIVFTWQASSGQYVNATYGSLSALSYTASASASDMTDISLFSTSNPALVQQCASNAYALMQADAAGYIGSVSVCTQVGFSANVPAQATPDGVAAAALRFVGQAWNEEGCWVLASTIAAEAGAALPVQSTAIGVAGAANGEWIPLFNGPAGGSGNWQALVSTGDVVVFGTPGGGGHVTTCVSGSGSSALLVDNVTYVNSYGTITNPARDGSSADVLIAMPHAASQEWSGVAASSVVIYALDTPLVTDTAATRTLLAGKTLILSSAFSATDPAHKAITGYQVFESNAADTIYLNGLAEAAYSAATAVSAASLGGLSLLGGISGSDALDVRAFNGTYWGDWQVLTVTVNPPSPLPPVLTVHTPNQVWQQGADVALSLPAALFTDPQHLALTYGASLANGAVLPGWLDFSAAAMAFSGIVPAAAETLSVRVTASDSQGMSSSETFSVAVTAAAAHGGSISLVEATGMSAADWLGADSISPPAPERSGMASGWPVVLAASQDIPLLAAAHHAS